MESESQVAITRRATTRDGMIGNGRMEKVAIPNGASGTMAMVIGIGTTARVPRMPMIVAATCSLLTRRGRDTTSQEVRGTWTRMASSIRILAAFVHNIDLS